MALTACAVLSAAPTFEPPRLMSARGPGIPPMAVGWLSSLAVAYVDAAGRVVKTRAGPDETGVAAALKEWRFSPATVDSKPVPAAALVAVLFRPPVLLGAVPPPDIPAAAAALGRDVPVPTHATAPPYPPTAIGDGVVVVEVLVRATGEPETVRIVVSAPLFDSAAIDAARGWRFRPALRAGVPVRGTACLVLGFRAPATDQISIADFFSRIEIRRRGDS